METFTSEIMNDLLSSSLKTAFVDENGWYDYCKSNGSAEGKHIA